MQTSHPGIQGAQQGGTGRVEVSLRWVLRHCISTKRITTDLFRRELQNSVESISCVLYGYLSIKKKKQNKNLWPTGRGRIEGGHPGGIKNAGESQVWQVAQEHVTRQTQGT